MIGSCTVLLISAAIYLFLTNLLSLMIKILVLFSTDLQNLTN